MDIKQDSIINCIEEVNNLAVISYNERPIIKIYDSTIGDYIKKIDISNICITPGESYIVQSCIFVEI